MAGHRMFNDATVTFTEDFLNSLPRKLSEYSATIEVTFQLTISECGRCINCSTLALSSSLTQTNKNKEKCVYCVIYHL